jgi:pimeloyl-ACP methyl ester carboxylesterase
MFNEGRISMPTFEASPGVRLHYLVDDFTDPWTAPETLLRRFRTVRPDMRGYGASTPMPRDFAWSLDVIIEDYARLMDSLDVRRFHLVGAKIGGVIARAFAARRPERVRTLTIVGSPPPVRKGAERIPALTEEFETRGVEHWARRTMAGRLGDKFPAEGVEWWIRFMGRAPVSTIAGFNATINYSDILADVPKIVCPMLVITTDESGLASGGGDPRLAGDDPRFRRRMFIWERSSEPGGSRLAVDEIDDCTAHGCDRLASARASE